MDTIVTTIIATRAVSVLTAGLVGRILARFSAEIERRDSGIPFPESGDRGETHYGTFYRLRFLSRRKRTIGTDERSKFRRSFDPDEPDAIPIRHSISRLAIHTRRDHPIFRQTRFWFNARWCPVTVPPSLRRLCAMTHAICGIDGNLATKSMLYRDYLSFEGNVVSWFLYWIANHE